MIKPGSLRDALTAANRWCKARPEMLSAWVEKGHIRISDTGEPSFIYVYTINVLVMEFPGTVDDLMLPVLTWVRANQPDLLLNPDRQKLINFDADIISDDLADIMITVPVEERVKVTVTNGVAKTEHLSEERPRFFRDEWEILFDADAYGEIAP